MKKLGAFRANHLVTLNASLHKTLKCSFWINLNRGLNFLAGLQQMLKTVKRFPAICSLHNPLK